MKTNKARIGDPGIKKGLFNVKKGLKIVLWIVCALCLLLTVVFIPSVASVLFLLVALIVAPLPFLKDVLSRIHLSGAKAVILALILFVIGFFSAPTDRAHNESAAPIPTEAPSVVSEVTPEIETRSIAMPAETPEATSTPAQTATPAPTSTPAPTPTPTAEKTYILNTSTMKFHKPTCSSVSDIAEYNKQEYVGTRDDLIANGYDPCGRCHP